MSNFIRSEQLAVLRNFLDQHNNIENIVGSIFQLRLVIDTNAVISDLLWMSNREKEGNQPAILEAIRAGTLIVYAPEQLKNEIEEHLPNIAIKRNIPFNKIQVEWETYQQHLKFIKIEDSELVTYEDSVDPKDAPFVVLSKMFNIQGIISKDQHIEQLGGRRINFDIGLSLRDYSRSATIVYSLRIGGVLFSNISIGTLLSVVQALSKLTKGIRELSDNAKLTMLLVIIIIFIIPDSRKYIFEKVSQLKGILGDVWLEVEPLIMKLVLAEREKNEKVKINLEKIQRQLLEH